MACCFCSDSIILVLSTGYVVGWLFAMVLNVILPEEDDPNERIRAARLHKGELPVLQADSKVRHWCSSSECVAHAKLQHSPEQHCSAAACWGIWRFIDGGAVVVVQDQLKAAQAGSNAHDQKQLDLPHAMPMVS